MKNRRYNFIKKILLAALAVVLACGAVFSAPLYRNNSAVVRAAEEDFIEYNGQNYVSADYLATLELTGIYYEDYYSFDSLDISDFIDGSNEDEYYSSCFDIERAIVNQIGEVEDFVPRKFIIKSENKNKIINIAFGSGEIFYFVKSNNSIDITQDLIEICNNNNESIYGVCVMYATSLSNVSNLYIAINYGYAADSTVPNNGDIGGDGVCLPTNIVFLKNKNVIRFNIDLLVGEVITNTDEYFVANGLYRWRENPAIFTADSNLYVNSVFTNEQQSARWDLIVNNHFSYISNNETYQFIDGFAYGATYYGLIYRKNYQTSGQNYIATAQLTIYNTQNTNPWQSDSVRFFEFTDNVDVFDLYDVPYEDADEAGTYLKANTIKYYKFLGEIKEITPPSAPRDWWGAFWFGVGQFFTDLGKKIGEAFGWIYTNIIEPVIGLPKIIFDATANALKQVGDFVGEVLEDLPNIIEPGIIEPVQTLNNPITWGVIAGIAILIFIVIAIIYILTNKNK